MVIRCFWLATRPTRQRWGVDDSEQKPRAVGWPAQHYGDCRLDGDAFAPCASPEDYAGMVVGSHTFQARARRIPREAKHDGLLHLDHHPHRPHHHHRLPHDGWHLQRQPLQRDCGTAPTGEVCGAADDDVTVTAVKVCLFL